MPIIVNGHPMQITPSSVAEFYSRYPHLREGAHRLCRQVEQTVGPEGLLYVGQREYAATTPEDNVIKLLGTSDATTCHIVVLRHTGNGTICLSHCDGVSTRICINNMLKLVHKLSQGSSDGRLELHMVGGFKDKKGSSEKLSIELLGEFNRLQEAIHLVTACITDENDVVKDGVHYPVFYGLVVDVRTGNISKSKFTDKGPDLEYRSASHFTGGKDVPNIYDNATQHLVIGPLQWDPWPDVIQWLAMPDSFLRKHLSTSPEQEPADFVANTRKALMAIRDHPEPEKSLFPNNMPRRYQKGQTDKWTLIR